MRTPEERTTSKRELINAAVHALGPARDASHQWAMRRATTRLARCVRDAQEMEQLSPGREELRVRLEEICETARSLARAIGGPGVSEAFRATRAPRALLLSPL